MFKRVRSEIDLIQASQQGDAQAFEIIVRQYQSLVCAITYSGTGCMDASEELAQETLLQAWQNLKQLREPRKFQAWLCTIARNTVQDWRRSRGRTKVSQASSLALAADQASETAEPVDTAIKQEQEIVVSRALDHIPEKYREPLILYYRESKSVREVAGLLSLTENTARQRITRARSMLKQKVSDMVETTLTHTRPGKAFTAAVMSSLVAGTIKTTATSAAGIGMASVIKGIFSGVAAKLIITAAAVMIVAGGGLWLHDQQSEGTLANPEAAVQAKPVDTESLPPIPVREAVSDPTASFQAELLSRQTVASQTPNPVDGSSQAKSIVAKKQSTSGQVPVLRGRLTDMDTDQPITRTKIQMSPSGGGRIYSTMTDSE